MSQIEDKEYVFTKDYLGNRYVVPLDLEFVEGYPAKDGWYSTYLEAFVDEDEPAWVVMHCYENGKITDQGFFVDTTHPDDVKQAEMVDLIDEPFMLGEQHAPLQWWLPEVQEQLEIKYGLKELQDNMPTLDEVIEPWKFQAINFAPKQSPSLIDLLKAVPAKFREMCIKFYTKITIKD